jgi:hypothetical protein
MRWAGLRTRCSSGGGQSPALQPDSESTGKGLMAEEEGISGPRSTSTSCQLMSEAGY